MIYTVTLNPSIDYVMEVLELKIGQVSRSLTERIYPGGKGINVSIALTRLGCKNSILGITAGRIGKMITDILRERGLNFDTIHIEGSESRINIKLRDQAGTEINGAGPSIPESAFFEVKEKLQAIKEGDFLVLSGKPPIFDNSNIYIEMLKIAHKKNVLTVIDTSGEELKNAIKYSPFLIKPNIHELGEIFNETPKNIRDIVNQSKLLQKQGALNVLVSMAEEGGVLITENGEIFERRASKGILKNKVGAGDAMVAGFLAEYKESRNYEKSLDFSIKSGSAWVFSEPDNELEYLYYLKLLKETIYEKNNNSYSRNNYTGYRLY